MSEKKADYLDPSVSRDLHRLAEKVRELGDPVRALILFQEVLVYDIRLDDHVGVAQAFWSMGMCFKHLFGSTKMVLFAKLCRQRAEDSLKEAREHNLERELAPALLLLGQAALLLGDPEEAVRHFEEMLNHFDGVGRPEAERGDYIYHLGEALCRLGRVKEGVSMIHQGLSHIRQHRGEMEAEPVGCFLADVWESGGEMRL